MLVHYRQRFVASTASPIIRRKFIRWVSQLSPVEQYDKDVESGKIRSDPHQRGILNSLNGVYEELVTYHRDHAKAEALARGKKIDGFMSRLYSGWIRSKTITDVGPRGIYMYGDVGSGKTMLMDMFYRTVPEHLTKRRLHFHAFMQEMHKLIHTYSIGKGSREDAIVRATHQVAAMYDVLCLDEVAVIDVADAMILRHIWEVMYADGMTTFMTSNRHPDDLYLNGVQRKSFLPAIELLKSSNHIIFLDSPTDYRKLPRPESGTYFFASAQSTNSSKDNNANQNKNNTNNTNKNDADADAKSIQEAANQHVKRWFEFFAKGELATTERKLNIWGRPVPIPLSAGDNVMQFTFDELCGQPRSAADYLEMCKSFPAVIITDIPAISLEQRDLIRRFITFLDAAYDSHAKLAVTAERPFSELFNTKHLHINPQTNKVELIGQDDSQDLKVDLTNFAGHEEMFAFARALSRLKQMSSAEWLDFERD